MCFLSASSSPGSKRGAFPRAEVGEARGVRLDARDRVPLLTKPDGVDRAEMPEPDDRDPLRCAHSVSTVRRNGSVPRRRRVAMRNRLLRRVARIPPDAAHLRRVEEHHRLVTRPADLRPGELVLDAGELHLFDDDFGDLHHLRRRHRAEIEEHRVRPVLDVVVRVEHAVDAVFDEKIVLLAAAGAEDLERRRILFQLGDEVVDDAVVRPLADGRCRSGTSRRGCRRGCSSSR